MKKKFNLCGIFSTMFVAATIFTISSCSQDDDYYESDMYTMAEPLETRAAEPGGEQITYFTYYYANNVTETNTINASLSVSYTMNCPINLWGFLSPTINSDIIILNTDVIPHAEFSYRKETKQSDHYLVEFKVRYSEYENDSLVNKETSIIPCRLPLNSIILSSNDPVVQPND